MIRTAQKNDIPRMTEIWKQCFGDSDEYIGFFMQNRFGSAVPLVCEADEKVVSQLFMLPGEMRVKAQKFGGFYIFAAATDPEYRGYGYMAELIGKAKKYAYANEADFIALVPGEESLYGYYERFSFQKAFAYREITLTRAEAEHIACREYEACSPSSGELDAFIQKSLDATDSFIWDSSAIAFAAEEFTRFRGKAVYVSENGSLCGASFIDEDGGEVVAQEIYVQDEAKTNKLLRGILHASEAETLRLRTRTDLLTDTGTVFDGGMIFPVTHALSEAVQDISQAYIGFRKD